MIYRKDYTYVMSDKLPEGKSGDYLVVKTAIKKGQLVRTYSISGLFYFDHVNTTMPYVKLIHSGEIIMSDSPMEQEGLRIPTILAHGNTMIVGLGLGLLPTLIRTYNRRVNRMLIVEESQDVVKLVYPHIRNRKTDLRVCEGKKFLASCQDKFDFIFIDVWPGITGPIKEIDEWTELARTCLTEKGEVRCWLQELYDRIKSKIPKELMEATRLPGYHEPCLICGKTLRNDYAGLCMDCADSLGVSELCMQRR